MKLSAHKLALKLPVGFVLWIAIAAQTMSACSTSTTSIEVPHHFLVEVFDRGKPVSGMQIQLSVLSNNPDVPDRVLETGTTDENGAAAFAQIKAGNYFVVIKHEAFGRSVGVLVKRAPSKNAQNKITFEWPGVKILRVQFASGLLNGQIRTENLMDDLIHPAFQPLAGAKLSLLEVVSERLIDAQQASESGAFGFQSVPPGVYLLKVEMLEQVNQKFRADDGYVPIEISPSASAATLNLFLSPGVCGSLAYKNDEATSTQ